VNPVEFQNVRFAYDDESSEVFTGLTLTVPPGVTSLTGPNGAGKSTFLLLASGRLLPTAGAVLLEGEDTAGLDDAAKNRLCSLVYQNMEFETEEPLGDLLEFVQSNGFAAQERGLLKLVTDEFELGSVLHRPTQHLSKGEMQRAVMAFSMLYGSRVVVMDEPVFAMEDGQKRRALEFVADHSRRHGVSFLYSAHELELTRDFSDRVLLFAKEGEPRLGSADDLLTRESLEAAYQVPYALLNHKERLYRSALMDLKTDK
jgi:ABC-type cobalamin/Fe3+-siderophores transport system ATPase subunit